MNFCSLPPVQKPTYEMTAHFKITLMFIKVFGKVFHRGSVNFKFIKFLSKCTHLLYDTNVKFITQLSA